MAPERRSDPRNVQVARQPAACSVNRPPEAQVESPCEAEEFNVTDLRHELRNLLASIQLAVDTMTRCRPSCPAAATVRSNVRFQIARLSKLLEDLDRAAIASDRHLLLMGRQIW